MDAIDSHVARNPGSPILLDVLGTVDAATIRARATELDPETAEVFFFGASVGVLFGIRRRDGSRVAMKLHKLFTDETYFDAVQSLQAALADAGFPAPRPIARRGTVTWEQWLDEGSFRDAHEQAVRQAMASSLVRFQRLATETGIRPRRTAGEPVDGTVWPVPHNALFDFDATAAGAEWIDEIGRVALPLGRGTVGDEVVGHTDWAAKHLRFDDELQPTALYDWDSVTTAREPTLVGSAAGSFTYTEELDPPVARWPTAEESLAFIGDYEVARGTPFTVQERRAAQAACVYLRAYAARCHHAYGGHAADTGLERVADLLL